MSIISQRVLATGPKAQDPRLKAIRFSPFLLATLTFAVLHIATGMARDYPKPFLDI